MGAVPVLSSLALGFDGQYYNINADEMASACAVAAHADALVFLTDVPGVRGADGEVMRWLIGESDCAADARCRHQRRHAAEAGRLPRGTAAWRETGAHTARGSGIVYAGPAPGEDAHGTEVLVA